MIRIYEQNHNSNVRTRNHHVVWVSIYLRNAVMLEKFRILKLTNYSRVMYLDYDVMPTCNLDYLFELSDPLLAPSPTNSSFRLKENVILAYKHEPCAGGLFILKPNATDFDQIKRIIHEKEIRSFAQKFPHWDQSYVSSKIV